MKKIYILGIAALTAGSVMAAPSLPSVVAKSKKSHKTEQRKSFKKEPRLNADAGSTLWRAGTMFLSEWDPYAETWNENAKYLTTYDSEGHILTQEAIDLLEGTSTLTSYTYNEFGMPVSRLVQTSEDGENYVNYSQTIREYDPVVHSCIISNTESIWMDEAWNEAGNCYRREVTRNADGNVTEVVIKTLYMGNYEASQKMSVEYGEDGKASRMISYVLTTDDGTDFVWQPEMEYLDMVWHHTNGQILSMDDMSTAENGVSSCLVMDNDGENHVTVEYPDNNGSFKSHLVYDFGELDVNMTVLDSYGSYDYSQKEIYREEGEEDYVYMMEERYRINEYGLETEVYGAEGEDPEDLYISTWMQGEIESNPDYGYPELYTLRAYDPYSEEYENVTRIKFEDYSDVAGVKGVSVDNSQAPVEYYNLQGVRIQGEPAPGLYIRKQGTEATKILKK